MAKLNTGTPSAATPGLAELKPPPKLALQVEMLAPQGLTPYPRNARRHSPKQISQIAASIRQFGFVAPVLIGADSTILAGHGRVAAAELLGLPEVPAIRLAHLSEAERRAYILADNRLAELSQFDDAVLALELQDLAALELDFPPEITGFDGARLDSLLAPAAATADPAAGPAADRADQPPAAVAAGPPVTRPGDLWALGQHRLLCGDATAAASYAVLLAGEPARMVFTDPPGAGPIAAAHLRDALACAAEVTVDGGVHFVVSDGRAIERLIAVGRELYAELLDLVVWVKDHAGAGTFYRAQHELIAVFKVGQAPAVNTFGAGESGRYRANCWSYPAVAGQPRGKPVALVADALRDVSQRHDLVLDPFGGAGTTLIAAERARRRARLMAQDPRHGDAICRRWRAFSGAPAVLADTGQTFDAVAAARAEETADVEA